MMNEKRMRRLRRLAIVPRWVTVPMTRRQSVAEHSFHVAWIVLWLAERSAAVAQRRISKETLMYVALTHDESESATGDIATPFKKYIVDEVSDFEYKHGMTSALDPYCDDQFRVIIKLADMIEAAIWIQEEQELGNRTLEPIKKQIWERIDKLIPQFENIHDKLSSWPLEKDILGLMASLRQDNHPSMEY